MENVDVGEMADVKIQDPACHLRRIEGGEELCERQYFKGRKNDGKPARDRARTDMNHSLSVAWTVANVISKNARYNVSDNYMIKTINNKKKKRKEERGGENNKKI